MSAEAIFLCPRCLTAAAEPGACLLCGAERLGCTPGEPDDPCRRPVVDAGGQVRTRAPLWWLRQSVAPLTSYLERSARPRE